MATLEERYEKLKDFYRRKRRLPSYQELLSLWQFASKNAVSKTIEKLCQEGYLEKTRGKLSPTKAFFSLNLYGQVPAGFPVPTPDDNADLMSLDDYLIEHPSSTFLLKVSGDSLKDIGILPKDLVLVERNREAKTGQVVLAHIDGEWTLKIYSRENGRAILLPANSKYKPIIPKEELKIYGVVKGVVRKY